MRDLDRLEFLVMWWYIYIQCPMCVYVSNSTENIKQLRTKLSNNFSRNTPTGRDFLFFWTILCINIKSRTRSIRWQIHLTSITLLLKNNGRENRKYVLKKDKNHRTRAFIWCYFTEWKKHVDSFKSLYINSKMSVKYINFCKNAKERVFAIFQQLLYFIYIFEFILVLKESSFLIL